MATPSPSPASAKPSPSTKQTTIDLSCLSGKGIAAKALEVAKLAAGKPYLYGGKSTEGFDCSGFVSYVFSQLQPNASAAFSGSVASYESNKLFEKAASPQPGDLIVFPGHIGIVLDADYWIGSQSSTGVAKVAFTEKYYWGKKTKYFLRLKSTPTQAIQAGVCSATSPP